ncbi:MAG: NAD(P)/FAD-dependent oxidoreductase [Pseudomonadota bacterium]
MHGAFPSTGSNGAAERSKAPQTVAVLGGGPAGLTTAYALARDGGDDFRPLVFERGERVGGIARTEVHNGYRFDIGGHRFFTKVPEVEAMWEEVLGEDFITVPRLSRIFYRDRFFDYPLKLTNALRNLGLWESFRSSISYVRWQFFPTKSEESFEEWVINRFGRRLYNHFFKTYTEKVWGVPATEIRADWAAQRIKNLTLGKAVWNAISGSNDTVSLIERFRYPRLGPGMMWERTAEIVEAKGGSVSLQTEVGTIHRKGTRVEAIEVREEGGEWQRVETDHFVSSCALRDLIGAFEPAPPAEVVEAAGRLRYRDFLIVTLVLDRADPFPDNWIYVHSPEVSVGRIQNFRAWSPEMLPDANTASIGMEYFCQENDGLWEMSDDDLRALAAKELERIGLARREEVIDGFIIRQPKAYPVYDQDYRDALDTVSTWLQTFENFQCVGRNGQHRYNNQDHSMLTALLAAYNIMGGEHDVWDVNLERSYHEDFVREKEPQPVSAPATA